MRKSEYTENQQLSILLDQAENQLSIEAICSKYNISTTTFYRWKNKFFPDDLPFHQEHSNSPEVLRTENDRLRKLYISLSEHNYELAKFLNK